MKQYLNETVAFIADIHTITKIKVSPSTLIPAERRASMHLYFTRAQ